MVAAATSTSSRTARASRRRRCWRDSRNGATAPWATAAAAAVGRTIGMVWLRGRDPLRPHPSTSETAPWQASSLRSAAQQPKC
eukprot:4115820-Pyramimonas_sp.AAC.1